MPITPLHLGPALLIKGALGPRREQHLGLFYFALAQGVMDAEVIARLLLVLRPGGFDGVLDSSSLHGFSNTLFGATGLVLPTLLLGRWSLGPVARWWNRQLSQEQARWLALAPCIPWRAAWLGTLLGIYSHWWLDAVMHPDARPLAPFVSDNPWLDSLPIGANSFCLISFGVGAALLLWGAWKRRQFE